jgi:hypothetical protein
MLDRLDYGFSNEVFPAMLISLGNAVLIFRGVLSIIAIYRQPRSDWQRPPKALLS